MGLILRFRSIPSPRGLDVADDGLATGLDGNVFDSDRLLALATMPVEGQVFALVDAGKTRGEAAQALGISIRSVFRILRSREDAEKAPVAPPVARIRARPQVGT
jgi:hypothetical protein